MPNNKRLNFTKNDISNYIGLKTGLPKSYVAKIVNDLITSLSILSKKGKLNIKNFGTFNILNKAERVGRNPKTNEEFKIKARKSLSFVMSKNLNKKINF